MRYLITFISLLLSCIGSTIAQNPEYEYKTFMASDGAELNYRLLRPEEEKAGKKYPLVIFLHGAGERGSDNQKQLIHGSQMFLNPVNREAYPAYVIFPQCPKDSYWAYKKVSYPFEDMKAEKEMPTIFNAVKELIDTYLEYSYIDRSRVYVIGLSMGGMATYDIVARFPELFAAAVPICGAVDTSRLYGIEDVSFRIFHGDADDSVPVECSRKAYKALKDSGVEVEYYEFPGCGHVSWNLAFSKPDFMEWLFKQKKSRKYIK